MTSSLAPPKLQHLQHKTRRLLKENLVSHLPCRPPPAPPPPSHLALAVRLHSLTAFCFGSSSHLRPRPPTVAALSVPPVKHLSSRCWLCVCGEEWGNRESGVGCRWQGDKPRLCVSALSQGEGGVAYAFKSNINCNICCPIAAAIHVQNGCCTVGDDTNTHTHTPSLIT